MITSIRLVNFKNFADETLRVGPFTVIVGANASGKSNIRDAFRFLHGIGRGYTLAEIFGGKREAGWQPIRGAMNEIVRFGQSSFTLEIGLKLNGEFYRYSIEVGLNPDNPNGFHVMREELRTESAMVYTSMENRDSTLWLRVGKNGESQIGVSRSQPALTQLFQRIKVIWYRHIAEVGLDFFLERMRFLDLSPERMREPAFPGTTVLGDSGENLPTVLRDICTDPEREAILTSWIAELTPMDVTGFEFPVDPSGRVHLTLCEANGRKVSAYSASDGTLRFLGVLAALLGDGPERLYFFEELDTGIHPVRLGLLLDMLEGPVRGNAQVIGTTHAPTLLTAMSDETFENTSVVCRLEDTADAIIRSVAQLPNARELRQDQGLGRLHESGGWRMRFSSPRATTNRRTIREGPRHPGRLPQRQVHSEAAIRVALSLHR